MTIFQSILLGFLVVCAISVSFSRNLLNSILIYMSCLIYAMISFLSVVVLSKVYIGIYEEKRHKAEHPEEDAETDGGMSDGSF